MKITDLSKNLRMVNLENARRNGVDRSVRAERLEKRKKGRSSRGLSK